MWVFCILRAGPFRCVRRVADSLLDWSSMESLRRFAVRIKDSKAATLVGFHGLKWYPPNEHYRVTAKWIPYSPPKTIKLATMIGTAYDAPVPGAAGFQWGG